MWSESPLPVDPMNALQIRVSKLRRALKSIGVDDGAHTTPQASGKTGDGRDSFI